MERFINMTYEELQKELRKRFLNVEIMGHKLIEVNKRLYYTIKEGDRIYDYTCNMCGYNKCDKTCEGYWNLLF